MPADHVDARMLRCVFDAADGGQQLHIGAMRPQLIADDGGARLVFLAWRIDGGNADQTSREIHDFISGAIDFRDDPID